VLKASYFVGLTLIFCIALNATVAEATTVYFPETDIGGGILGSGQAEITSGESGGKGYVDIVLTNTSPLGPVISPDGRANPFIMEIEFKYIDGFTLDEGSSYVSSLSDSLFAQGAGNPAVNLTTRNLAYNLVDPDSFGIALGKCFMTANADNIRNDNTVGSADVLDGSYIPLEGWADGFLNTQPDTDSGTVFDSIRFHLAFNEGGIPDTSLYAVADMLYIKFVGGGDYSDHVSSIPEPASVLLIGLGFLAILRKRKR
jgi:hypothetical protein